ncbi:MAG: hypothetical protein V7691_06110 [Galbibacter orientalis]|uniref:hypothetical protein n=1 Tax=Galbibacter orientalis TaxID=453852 RepID=UPI0030035BC6
MKLLYKILISFIVVLITGYSLLFANSNKEECGISIINGIESSTHSGVELIKNAQSLSAYSFSNSEKKNHRLEIIESEVEEEVTSYKKQVELNNFINSTLFSLALIAFFPFPKKHLFHCKKLPNSLSYRLYVIFRVFRI